MSEFFNRIYEIVSQIPYGKVVSYGQIASFLGSPRSGRMVGWAMHTCPDGLPWHRVIKKTGELPFSDGDSEGFSQKELLEQEGIVFLPDGFVDMDRYEWEIELPD